MIVSPHHAKEWEAMSAFLLVHAKVHPTPDQRMIGWVDEETEQLVIVCGMSGFMGKLCQIHIAFADGWHFSPRSMLEEVFNYAFNEAGREMLLGVVNSRNLPALRFDFHLGFKELYRIPRMHDDDGDVVLLGMRKEECKYLRKKEDASVSEHSTGGGGRPRKMGKRGPSGSSGRANGDAADVGTTGSLFDGT